MFLGWRVIELFGEKISIPIFEADRIKALSKVKIEILSNKPRICNIRNRL